MSLLVVTPRVSCAIATATIDVLCRSRGGMRRGSVARRALTSSWTGRTALPLLAREGSEEGAAGGGSAGRSGRARRPPPPPPFPVVDSCPEATCTCEAMPELPAELPIDHESRLNGLISAYNEQVIVCTGKDDWPSRIEDDNSGDNLAADLKELFGRGGKYSDPFHNVSVLNASFAPSVPLGRPELQTSSAYLLPSFRYVPFLPRVSFDSVDALAKGYLLPEHLHSAHAGLLSPVHRDRLTRQPAYRRLLWGVRDRVDDVLVLVCGHGGRDARCGLVGPVLRSEFERQLARVDITPLHGPVAIPEEEMAAATANAWSTSPSSEQKKALDAPLDDSSSTSSRSASIIASTTAKSRTARVGLISHIGGHKFAGNVIIYLPPSLRALDGFTPHPLAGYGVWYGRVEPKHVEGLVLETILRGNVVTDHFRGAINSNRDIIRL
ncbi:sucrose cleavage family protein [Grosmannia clavigera kw1407]|uniref:Altered inheritance of mitochondria protein 32 n=1 Tax=Grosmannia clavigera (strain kw1407 / UAMH 11150) TaxID=655863 RepID=F0XFS9_GROCL|nr:sucrose cleavage family protein [Grosmannia clavigera kw1407]EFX03927.1 sucrose cleavage family protein [Grosmannia clavigera kw1407]